MSGKTALGIGALAALCVVAAAVGTAEPTEAFDYSFLAELVRNVADFATEEDDAAEGIYKQLKSDDNPDISR